MALRNDMHGGVRQNLANGFYGAASKPAIPPQERERFRQNFFRRVNIALREQYCSVKRQSADNRTELFTYQGMASAVPYRRPTDPGFSRCTH